MNLNTSLYFPEHVSSFSLNLFIKLSCTMHRQILVYQHEETREQFQVVNIINQNKHFTETSITYT